MMEWELKVEFNLQKNLIVNGTVLTGSTFLPDTQMVFTSNLFGYSLFFPGGFQPIQLEVKNNFYGFSRFMILNLWSQNENTYGPQAFNSLITNNTILSPRILGNYLALNAQPFSVLLSTSAWVTYRDVATLLSTPFHSSDKWNSNTYDATTFNVYYFVNGIASDNTSQPLWQVLTRQSGNSFDTNGNWITPPPNTFYLVLNEYDNTLVNLGVYNFGASGSSVTFNLCCFLQNQASWTIYDTKAPTVGVFNSVANTCGSISVNFGLGLGLNFKSYLVVLGSPANDSSFRPCGSSYVLDELVSDTLISGAITSVNIESVTAAVVGSITLVVVLISSIVFSVIHFKEMAEENSGGGP